MQKFDFETKQITPEWLTSILVTNGFLSRGKVSSVEQEILTPPGSNFVSNFFSLKINYSQENRDFLPSKFLIKMVKPEYYELMQIEVDFYEEVLKTKAPLPVVTCYGAEKSPETKQYYLLLDDLTLTHYRTESPLPPTQNQCKEAIATLAKIHAHWWNHPNIGESIFKIPSEEEIRQWVRQAEKQFSPFADFLGDRLSEKRKKTYELIFEKFPELACRRISSSKQLTLIHRDTHYGNFLFPYNKEESQCVLIDWQTWGIGRGGNDLSYMIALHWYSERRQRMEQSLLKYYLQEMQRHHINYVWKDFWADYRVCAIGNLLVPIRRHSRGRPPVNWWPLLENVFAAFEDLNCLEFL